MQTSKSPLQLGIQRILTKLDRIQHNLSQEKEFLDVNAACEYLSISKSTLYSFTRQKLIPSYRPLGKLYFRIEDLDNFILSKENKSEPISEAIKKSPKNED